MLCAWGLPEPAEEGEGGEERKRKDKEPGAQDSLEASSRRSRSSGSHLATYRYLPEADF